MKKTIDDVHKNKTGSQKTTNRRKLADVSQLAIEEKFRDLLENVQEGYFEIDLAGNFTFINEPVCRVLGYSKKELMGINSRKFTDQDDGKKVFQAYNKVYKTKKPLKNVNWHIIRKDRSKRYIEGSISLRKDLSGKPIGFRVIANDFTERKRANEALRQSEERYRTLVENASDIIFRTDNTGHFTFVNPAALRITGYEEQVIIGMHYPSLIHPDMRSDAIKFFDRQFVKGLHNAYSEYPIITKDGHEVWLGQNTQLIVEDGNVKGFQSVARDISERKRAESQREAALEALRESEKKYRRITENMSDMVSDVDAQGFFKYISPSHQKILGYRPEDLLGTFAFDKFHPDDLDRVTSAYMEGVISKTDREVEYRYRHVDGHYIWLRSLGHSFYDTAGEYIGSIISSSDIAARKQMEDTLLQSEKKYRTILEEIQEGYFEVDLAGNFTFFNDSLCRFFDSSKEELMGMNYRQYTTDKGHSKELFKAFNKVYNTGEPTEGFDWQIIRKDGTKRYVEASISLRKDSSGKPIGFRGIARDVTEQRKSEELYRLLADNMTEHVWLMDLNTIKMTYVSPSVEKIYGYTSDEILKLPFKKFLTAESFLKVKDLLSNDIPKILSNPLSSVQKYSLELEVCHKDGHLLWIEDTLSFLRDENGKPSVLLGETRDITERKRAEEKLKETLENLRTSIKTTIQVLGMAAEARDPYTAGHQKRVADLARVIATEMGLAHEKIEGIRIAGSIHDIGKLSIPSEILSKPTKLTNLEFSLIKEHSRSGYEMLKDVESPWPLAQIIFQHHERMNGSGYPRNLKGDEIIMESRILAVADVVEAMASYRPYRPALGIDAALEEIEKNKGILYDDAVADACLRLFRERGYQLK